MMKKDGCYSYKHIPQEAIDYAMDQTAEKFSKGFRDTGGNMICFTGNIIKAAFEEALRNKIHDMLWEVRHDQREDFRRGQLENLEATGRVEGKGCEEVYDPRDMKRFSKTKEKLCPGCLDEAEELWETGGFPKKFYEKYGKKE